MVAGRLVHRDRFIGTRVAAVELARVHRIARATGLSLSELVRSAIRAHVRMLEADLARDVLHEPRGEGPP
jgi:hypothetical protein